MKGKMFGLFYYPKWIPNWLLTSIQFAFDNRWTSGWWRSGNYCVLWIGTEFNIGDPYQKYWNCYSFDFTIVNFGFKIIINCYPPKSYDFMTMVEEQEKMVKKLGKIPPAMKGVREKSAISGIAMQRKIETGYLL